MTDECNAAHFDPEALRARVIAEACGCLTEEDVAALAAHPTARLWQCLVRCGGGRFVTSAQDVAYFIGLIEREPGGDYVRDVNLIHDEAPHGVGYDPSSYRRGSVPKGHPGGIP
jgi:hypothetical protein